MSIANLYNVSVGQSPVQSPHNAVSVKESFAIYNLSTGKVFWGPDASVTVATGFPVLPSFAGDYGGPVWLISDTAAQDVRILLLR